MYNIITILANFTTCTNSTLVSYMTIRTTDDIYKKKKILTKTICFDCMSLGPDMFAIGSKVNSHVNADYKST